MTLKSYLIIGLVVVVAIVGWRIYVGYKELEDFRLKNLALEQNAKAYKDSADASYAQVQELAIFVRDLNAKDVKKNNEVAALKIRNSLLIDSIVVLKHFAQVILTADSTVQVYFQGSEGIADFHGSTLGNAKTKEGTYSLSISFPRPVETSSELYKDLNDNLWRIRTISLTPGVKIKGGGSIDENVWKQIEVKPPKKPDFLALGGMFSQDAVGKVQTYVGFALKPDDYMFLFQYNIGSFGHVIPWQNRVSIGFYWFLL